MVFFFFVIIILFLRHFEFLDLFSGSGSFGIECISRGANKVIFFENYYKSIEILKKNIKQLDLNKKSQIIIKDAYKINKSIFMF